MGEELPLPDYDHLTIGLLQTRLRSLDRNALRTLLEYERDHAQRPAALTFIESRLRQLEDGGEPATGDPTTSEPGTPAPAGTSAVSPATSGPATNPPAHGVPTNPAQPR